MKKVEITATELIQKRDLIINNLKQDWGIIEKFNDHDTRQPQQFDLPNVIKDIMVNEEKLVKIKLAIQCINMGLGSIAELQEQANYEAIYQRSILDERRKQVFKVLKRERKKEKFIQTILSDDFFKKLLSDTETDIAAISYNLGKFNKEKKFLIDIDI